MFPIGLEGSLGQAEEEEEVQELAGQCRSQKGSSHTPKAPALPHPPTAPWGERKKRAAQRFWILAVKGSDAISTIVSDKRLCRGG